jgi:AcrR family transcriptional regulator
MRAAEKLIAEKGIEGVTIRLILAEADQKNTSALQYHFKNLKGLIEAIHAERADEVQEARGRAGSEGTWRPYGDEGRDAYDTVEWAAAQPWSDGNVGLYGACALGWTAIQGAVEAPPHRSDATEGLMHADAMRTMAKRSRRSFHPWRLRRGAEQRHRWDPDGEAAPAKPVPMWTIVPPAKQVGR